MKVKIDEDFMIRSPIVPPNEVLERVLENAGLKKWWNDPTKGSNIYEVERMPEDRVLFGIKWIEVND